MVAPATEATPVREAASVRSLSAVFRRDWPLRAWLPVTVAALAFVLLFANPSVSLFHDWLTDDDAGQGLLLFPVALWLAWRAGIRIGTAPAIRSGTLILAAAVFIRILGSLASEFFSQRFAIWLAIVGLVVFCFGWRQVRHWWLPLTLLFLSIPLPALITNELAIPLQFRASRLGTALIKWRHIPVRVAGNVIQIPNATLFVAEACSGLRSLSALFGLGVLIGGMYLRSIPGRVLLLLLVIPVAVVLNAVRIFLTAFLVYFVDDSLAQGAAHQRQGLAMFIVAFAVMGVIAFGVAAGERLVARRMAKHA